MSSRVSLVQPAAATVFRHDAAHGVIRLPDERRIIACSESLLQQLHMAIIEQLGETAQDALYRTGYEWGLQEMLRLTRQLRAESGDPNFNLWQQNAEDILARWWSVAESLGWGAATFDVRAAARGFTFVELRHSATAEAFAGADQPVCHLYAGFFAGALSFCTRAERHGVEIQCAAMNHPACKFVVGPGPDVDAAEAWRQQGVAAPEILRRLS
jgi:predicted hydrocarbon binding protein